MFRYWLVILIIGMSAGYLFAAAGDEHTFELKWQQHGESYRLSEPLDRNAAFDKEPEFSQNGIFRGALSYLGQTNGNTEVGFIWDKSKGRLYVDLNRDGDLTNDSNGVLENEGNQREDCQIFPAFPLSFSTQSGILRYQVKANMQGYDWFKRADFTILSGYSGKIDLYGRQWHFGVNDNFKGIVRRGSRLSVNPTKKDATNFISSLSAPKSLFLDGRCYDMAFEFRKSDSGYPALWCRLTEKTVSTGKLRIESKWVNQLVLGDDEILILPEPVDGVVIAPSGDFTVKQCNLKYDKKKPAISPTRLNEIKAAVSEAGESILRIGGPLNHQVKIRRVGRVLKFDYELVGAGGEQYDAQQITNYDNNKKPSVAIYKGDMQVGSGSFEYG